MSDGKQVCQSPDSRQWKDATPPQHCSLTHIRGEVKKEGESEHRKKEPAQEAGGTIRV